jgi:predicted nucleic acid-binding Zn ribbon protein
MKPLKRVLGEAIVQDEILKAGRAQRVFRKWPEIVGELLAQKSTPERYHRGVVWVAVSGSSWAQELRMQRGIILKRLRELSGEPELFTSIRFGVRSFDVQTHALVEIEESGRNHLRKELETLTIREIAERRLKKMRNEDPS